MIECASANNLPREAVNMQDILATHKAENESRAAIARMLGFVALITGLLATFSPKEAHAEQLGGDIVILNDLLSPADFAISKGRIYALDSGDRRVTVFDLDGTLLRGFGREGEGPGEFERPPLNLDVHNHFVAVTEEYGRTTIFDTAGVFLKTFRTGNIANRNSQMRMLNDSLVFIGGFWQTGEDLAVGTMGHIYTVDGRLNSAFMPMSHMARLFRSNLVFGASCDYDSAQTLWCGQVKDYVIRHYDYAGNKIDSFSVAPEYYRPLRENQPDAISHERVRRWISTWDMTMELHTINDAFLLSEVYVGGGGYKLDIIDKRTGSVVATQDVEGRLVYVSREDQVLILQHQATEDPFTMIEIVPLATLLDEARN